MHTAWETWHLVLEYFESLGSWDLVYLGRPYPILPHHIAGPEKNNSTILDKFNNKSFVTWVFYVEFWPDFNIQNQSPS